MKLGVWGEEGIADEIEKTAMGNRFTPLMRCIGS